MKTSTRHAINEIGSILLIVNVLLFIFFVYMGFHWRGRFVVGGEWIFLIVSQVGAYGMMIIRAEGEEIKLKTCKKCGSKLDADEACECLEVGDGICVVCKSLPCQCGKGEKCVSCQSVPCMCE